MQAIVLTQYGHPALLQLKDVPKPTPKDDEVLVKVHAASINDWDWGLARGTPFFMRFFAGLRNPHIILGVDVAGRVEAVGKNVTNFQAGDDVYGDLSDCGFGSFAEYVSVPATALVSKPPKLTFEQAAAIPHAACLAMQGLRKVGQLQPGQTLLINGAAGGVGTLGIQIAQTMGVTDVTGVDSAQKLKLMHSLGYQHTIDYRQEDFTKGGKQYDLILDCKTNRSPFDYTRALNPNGRYATVGGKNRRLLQALLLAPLIRLSHKKEIRILSLKPNGGLEEMAELFAAGKIEPIIDGPFPLHEVPKALQYFGEGKHTGKVIITIARI